MSRHDPARLRAFLNGETRQVWARVRATGEPVYLEDGTADLVRERAKAEWICIIPTCDSSMNTRGGSNRHVFTHPAGSGHGGGGGAESLNHQAAKAMLAGWARDRAPGAEVSEEVRVADEAAGLDRRPDVLVAWPEAVGGRRGEVLLALEVEYKRFKFEQWETKHEDLRRNGIACAWLLGHTCIQVAEQPGSSDLRIKVSRQVDILRQADLHILVINPITRQVGTLAGDSEFTSTVRLKQKHAWLALDELGDCDLTVDGIVTPTMRRIDEAERNHRKAREEAQRQRQAEVDERQRLARERAEQEERRRAEQRAREEAEQARKAKWDKQRQDWESSALHQVFVERFGTIPAVIEQFGEKPRGIDTNPSHWHAVLYENLIHTVSPGAEFTSNDCWRHLSATGIGTSTKPKAAMTSLTNFMTTLEAAGLIESTDGGWAVRGRLATAAEVRLRNERCRRQQAVAEAERRDREQQAALEAGFHDASSDTRAVVHEPKAVSPSYERVAARTPETSVTLQAAALAESIDVTRKSRWRLRTWLRRR